MFYYFSTNFFPTLISQTTPKCRQHAKPISIKPACLKDSWKQDCHSNHAQECVVPRHTCGFRVQQVQLSGMKSGTKMIQYRFYEVCGSWLEKSGIEWFKTKKNAINEFISVKIKKLKFAQATVLVLLLHQQRNRIQAFHCFLLLNSHFFIRAPRSEMLNICAKFVHHKHSWNN